MACLLLGSAFITISYYGIAVALLAVLVFVFLGASLMKSRTEKKYTDPYDLALLREFHEREEWREADCVGDDPEGDIVCPHCGHVYGHKFRVCPSCQRSP